MKLVVTGGRGFIGSHFVEEALALGYSIIDYDKMGYASHKTLPWDSNPNYKFIKEDIEFLDHLPSCDSIVNFAAESHVDNSINSPRVFFDSNISGVANLLELIRGKPTYDRPLFFHISTDEIYGDRDSGSFVETDRSFPSNPYSATKAAAEMLILAYHRTFGMDYVITRSSNNYGARQFEEKLIPKTLSCIRENKKVPLHGDGTYVRDWTYVKDNVSAILMLLQKGIKNDIYNIAAENYMTNLDVVKTILGWYNIPEDNYNKYYKFVPNRWGQDIRYAVSSQKLRSLGWNPQYEKGLYRWFD